jgi:hypothetical protein
MLLRPDWLTRCKHPASAPCDQLPQAGPAATPVLALTRVGVFAQRAAGAASGRRRPPLTTIAGASQVQ